MNKLISSSAEENFDKGRRERGCRKTVGMESGKPGLHKGSVPHCRVPPVVVAESHVAIESQPIVQIGH